jgi:uncharacterized membrane protein YqjE
MDWQNIHFGIASANRMFRSMLTIVGLMLLSFGVLIVVLPWLLQFLVGGTFILLGVALLGAAWRSRWTRRIPKEQDTEPDVIDEWR